MRASPRVAPHRVDAPDGSLPTTIDPRTWRTTIDSRASRARYRRAQGWWIYGSLTLTSTLLALRLLANILAVPLETAGAQAALPWQVEVTTSGKKPGIALAFGADVGIQLLRIPAGVNGASQARVVPARLAQGELHLVSLSFNSLRAHAAGAPGSGVVRVSATSPIITLFHSAQTSGIRARW